MGLEKCKVFPLEQEPKQCLGTGSLNQQFGASNVDLKRQRHFRLVSTSVLKIRREIWRLLISADSVTSRSLLPVMGWQLVDILKEKLVHARKQAPLRCPLFHADSARDRNVALGIYAGGRAGKIDYPSHDRVASEVSLSKASVECKFVTIRAPDRDRH